MPRGAPSSLSSGGTRSFIELPSLLIFFGAAQIMRFINGFPIGSLKPSGRAFANGVHVPPPFPTRPCRPHPTIPACVNAAVRPDGRDLKAIVKALDDRGGPTPHTSQAAQVLLMRAPIPGRLILGH